MERLLVKKLFSFFFLSLFSATSAFAVAPEEIMNNDSMKAQIVKGPEVTAPYMITGESLVAMLDTLVGFDIPGASIVFNRKTGQLFVKNTPTNHDIIEGVLSDLRKAQKKQVEIEARIITVSSTDFEGFGVDGNDWNFLSDNEGVLNGGDNAVFGFGTIDGQTVTDSPMGTYLPNLNNIFNTSGDGMNLALGIEKVGRLNLDSVIDALRRVADVNTLASPKIRAFNNQQANISIEKHKFYIDTITSEFTSEGGLITAVQDAEIRNAKSGTLLDVTPSINKNGTITLELHPSYVKADLSNTQIINNGSAGIANDSVTLPSFDMQEFNTTVTVENGGVVALGGLITEQEVNQHDKVPVLGDIPLIGKALFQNNQERNIKTHLVIFVKATTLEPMTKNGRTVVASIFDQ